MPATAFPASITLPHTLGDQQVAAPGAGGPRRLVHQMNRGLPADVDDHRANAGVAECSRQRLASAVGAPPGSLQAVLRVLDAGGLEDLDLIGLHLDGDVDDQHEALSLLAEVEEDDA
jgi:hypothetical protein